MKISIIGAGISGLTTALLCNKHGIEVELFESATELKPLGLGINLQPHATKIFAELGLLDDLLKVSVSTTNLEFRCNNDKLIYQEKRGINAGYKYPQLSIHRAKLQEVLLAEFIKNIGSNKLHLATRFVSYACNQDNEKPVDFVVENRKTKETFSLTTDILVGADGINSAVRQQLHNDTKDFHFEGIMLWRGITKAKPFADYRTIYVCGNYKVQLVVYPVTMPDINGDSYINWVVEILDETAQSLPDNCWNVKGGVEEFIHYFDGWKFSNPNIHELFYNAEYIFKFPMVDREPLESWGEGNITLIGDAAHPMYPRGGNGASQAIVDAKILVDNLNGANSFENALRNYEKERITVTSQVVRNNRVTNQVEIFSLVEQKCKGLCQETHICISNSEIDKIIENYRTQANASVNQVNS